MWAALGGDPKMLDGIRVVRERPILGSPLPVGELAIGCASAPLLAAAELAEVRGLSRPAIDLSATHVETAFTSERHVRGGWGSLGPGFDPLSTWIEVADGWLRTHANYPRHRDALLAALECPGGDLDDVRELASKWSAEELEEAIFDGGGCAAALRSQAVWEDHPQGRTLRGSCLADVSRGPSGASSLPSLSGDTPAANVASGIRVLDLTKVIAGPVATRTLAALGAEVMRIDAPDTVEPVRLVLDTGPGKRSARLDLRTPEGAAALERLVHGADVVVAGYRPGALEAHGIGAAELTERHPQLVTVSLSAWGHEGPWGERRGFDSLVQAASGIAVACTSDGAATPGVLPAQALDHGTGQMIAAAALRGLAERQRSGHPLHARFALARTAAFLLALQRGEEADREPLEPDPRPFELELPTHRGPVTLVAPPGRLDGRPLRWTRGPVPIGADAAEWAGG